MPAHVIATMQIHDPETCRKYTDLTPPTVKRHGGRFLTRGDPVLTAEGAAFTSRMVILEFPSTAHAEAWIKDPDYVAACRFRHAASTGRYERARHGFIDAAQFSRLFCGRGAPAGASFTIRTNFQPNRANVPA